MGTGTTALAGAPLLIELSMLHATIPAPPAPGLAIAEDARHLFGYAGLLSNVQGLHWHPGSCSCCCHRQQLLRFTGIPSPSLCELKQRVLPAGVRRRGCCTCRSDLLLKFKYEYSCPSVILCVTMTVCMPSNIIIHGLQNQLSSRAQTVH